MVIQQSPASGLIVRGEPSLRSLAARQLPGLPVCYVTCCKDFDGLMTHVSQCPACETINQECPITGPLDCNCPDDKHKLQLDCATCLEQVNPGKAQDIATTYMSISIFVDKLFSNFSDKCALSYGHILWLDLIEWEQGKVVHLFCYVRCHESQHEWKQYADEEFEKWPFNYFCTL